MSRTVLVWVLGASCALEVSLEHLVHSVFSHNSLRHAACHSVAPGHDY